MRKYEQQREKSLPRGSHAASLLLSFRTGGILPRMAGVCNIAPDSGRLQKFFGVSHIKIDPQLTDVTIVPQARLTMEQQVSSDVTLTYITNLEIANQQIVRIEWDFSRKWSAVALRDENGAFSIDFQYRKRFK